MTHSMYSVILCGGSGTRLWPLSRKNFPKQFLNLYSDKSLLQETYLRMREIMPQEHILFVTSQDGVYNVLNQIREIDPNFSEHQILAEPKSLNTAPAIALSVKYVTEKIGAASTDPIIFLPSDHYIGDKEAYLSLVQKAMAQVGGHIGTLGITPTKPETGYGYIRKGKKSAGNDFFKVLEFKEKPNKETAEEYLKTGEYVWNSGMYLFDAETFTNELRTHAPEIATLFDQPYDEFLAKFSELPSISIDYALSERSQNVIVFEGEFGWNDIGSFDSMAESFPDKKHPRHINVDSKNVFVHSESDRLIVTLGVEDLNIIESGDSILIQKHGRGEDVKKVVEELKLKKAKELDHNIVVHRPWGKYEVLMDNKRHKARRITVHPGATLSLRTHAHRAEHWIVVDGEVKITEEGVAEPKLFKENESVHVPSNTVHRLENTGKEELEIIEVQTGDSHGDDDTERFNVA